MVFIVVIGVFSNTGYSRIIKWELNTKQNKCAPITASPPENLLTRRCPNQPDEIHVNVVIASSPELSPVSLPSCPSLSASSQRCFRLWTHRSIGRNRCRSSALVVHLCACRFQPPPSAAATPRAAAVADVSVMWGAVLGAGWVNWWSYDIGREFGFSTE